MNRISADNQISDQELVCRAQGGDTAAFAQLVERYQDRVYNTCYRMCHNDADALDLTQSTFLRALDALERFQTRSSFYTWLFRIAVNLTISQHRRRKKNPALSLDADATGDRRLEPADPDGPPAGERVEHMELRERLESALHALDEEFRVAVVLKDVEEMDYATIAEVLGVPVGTVKSRIHRGRLLLRAALLAGEKGRGLQ